MAGKLLAKPRRGGGAAAGTRKLAARKMPQVRLSTASSGPKAGKLVKGISTRAVQTQPKVDWHGKPDTGPKNPA